MLISNDLHKIEIKNIDLLMTIKSYKLFKNTVTFILYLKN